MSDQTVELSEVALRKHSEINGNINPTKDAEVGVIRKDQQSKVSPTGSLMHLLKSNVGTGILAMPNAFANSGLLVGTVGLFIVGFVSVHCMHVLSKCYNELSTKENAEDLDYDKIAEMAFQRGPKCLQKRASIARRAVNLFLIITLIGICCVYSLFIAENIREFVKGVSNDAIDVDVQLILILQLPFMILFNFIQRLNQLTIGSMVANCIQTIGVLIIIYQCVIDMPLSSTRPLAVDVTRLPLFFGTVAFGMESIGMVIPLLKNTKDQNSFGGYFGVLNTAIAIVTCAYVAVGFYGFLKFGDEVKGSITLNLPSTPLCETVRLIFTLAIFHTYALQLYVPITITWSYLQKKFNLYDNNWKTMSANYAMRSSLVSLTVLLAAIVPKLDLFTSLTGAISSSFILFIFPPIIEISAFWNCDHSKRKWLYIIIKNILIIACGAFGIVTATFTSLSQLIQSFFESEI